MDAIFKRKSVRDFLDKDVEDSKIKSILKAAMAAPSAGNQQPWEFCVIKSKKILDELSKATPYTSCTAKANCAIVPCYRTNNLRFPEYTDIDMSASTENLLLEVTKQGLGAVWLGIAPGKDRIAKVKEILKLSDNIEPFAIVPIGYFDDDGKINDRFDESRIRYYGD